MSDSPPLQPTRSLHPRAWLILIILLGAFFRIAQWAWGQPFWTDEASLLLNVASKTARQLMGPLDFAQACPPVHLLMLRGLFVSLGDSSYSLRLASLTLALIALPMFVTLAWRMLPPIEAIGVASIFAFSDRVIWHASEAKQYTGDSLAVIVLLWIAFGWRTLRSDGARLLTAAIAAAAMLWLSHATLFLFSAISLAFAPSIFRERGGARRWLVANVVFGLSLTALYVLSIRVQRSPLLVHLWVDQFVPWQKPATIPNWLVRNLIGLCDYPVQGLGGALLTILCGCGAAELRGRRQMKVLATLLLPFAMLLGMSALAAFPLNGNRVTFFTVPLILLLAGYGSLYLRKKFVGRFGHAGRLALGLMVIDAFTMAAIHVVRPEPRTHIRPLIDYLKVHRSPDEGIYVIGKGTRSMFMWYWRGQPGPVLYKDELGPNLPIPWDRYWATGIFRPSTGIAEMQHDVNYAAAGAHEIERFQGDGSAAILYERAFKGPGTK